MIMDLVGPERKPTEMIALKINEKVPYIVAKGVREESY